MALPVMNAHVVSTPVFDINNASPTTQWQLSTAKDYALFAVAHAVDVSGMELAIQFSAAANTLLTQTIASGASTLSLIVVDAGTAASGAAAIQAGTDFNNNKEGGFTTHEAVSASPSGTTDLDADDWLNLNVVANATDIAGVVQVQAKFIHGIPGAIA